MKTTIALCVLATLNTAACYTMKRDPYLAYE